MRIRPVLLLNTWTHHPQNPVMTKSTNQETITFYDVPLVCGAAPSIGCGSRAKPLLVDLEQQVPIREAWLNRKGTIVAIVWRGQARMEEVGKPVFERHEIEYTDRPDDKQTSGSFRVDGSWLHGELSSQMATPVGSQDGGIAAHNAFAATRLAVTPGR
jgi:hypothetical protein